MLDSYPIRQGGTPPGATGVDNLPPHVNTKDTKPQGRWLSPFPPCKLKFTGIPMLPDADRKKAADILMNAEKPRQQAVQLSTTFPGITIDDAYAISTEVANRKMAA